MLTEELKDKLIAELSSPVYAGLSESQAFALLNDPRTVTTTTEKLKTLTVGGILSALAPGSVQKLLLLPCLLDVRDKIQAQDRDGVCLWAQVLAMGGAITSDEAAAVIAALAETEDVTTTETVPPRINTEFGGVAGMPNCIRSDEFTALWAEVKHG